MKNFSFLWLHYVNVLEKVDHISNGYYIPLEILYEQIPQNILSCITLWHKISLRNFCMFLMTLQRKCIIISLPQKCANLLLPNPGAWSRRFTFGRVKKVGHGSLKYGFAILNAIFLKLQNTLRRNRWGTLIYTDHRYTNWKTRKTRN